MIECESGSVQAKPSQKRTFVVLSGRVGSLYFRQEEGTPVAVEAVRNNGQSDRCEVDTHLMGTTCQRLGLYDRERPETLNEPTLRSRLLSATIDYRLVSTALIRKNRLVDFKVRLCGFTLNNSVVILLD